MQLFVAIANLAFEVSDRLLLCLTSDSTQKFRRRQGGISLCCFELLRTDPTGN